MTVTDQQLEAYLKGDLKPEDAAIIDAAVAEDQDLALRLAERDPLAGVVGSAFASVPDKDRMTRLDADIPDPAPTPIWQNPVGYVASLAAVAMLGFGFAVMSVRPAALDWHEQVAAYQVLYVPETVAALSPDPDALAAQFSRAEAALDLELHSETLGALDGLDLRRAQILGYEGQALIQIAFADAMGGPVAFCIMRQSQGGDKALISETLDGMAATHWQSGTFGFILIGGDDQDFIDQTAKKLSSLFAA